MWWRSEKRLNPLNQALKGVVGWKTCLLSVCVCWCVFACVWKGEVVSLASRERNNLVWRRVLGVSLIQSSVNLLTLHVTSLLSTDRYTNRQTDGHTVRQLDGQRQTERQICGCRIPHLTTITTSYLITKHTSHDSWIFLKCLFHVIPSDLYIESISGQGHTHARGRVHTHTHTHTHTL